jgi:hypothetical protein
MKTQTKVEIEKSVNVKNVKITESLEVLCLNNKQN